MDQYLYIPFSGGMNIHLPAILMFTTGIGFWPIPKWQDLVQELRDLPRNVCVRRVNEVVARARAVKVHMALGAQAAGDGFHWAPTDSSPK